MTTQMRQIGFGVLALIGAGATWYYNIQFMLESGGFSVGEFIQACYVNPASSSISNDVLVAVATFLFWSYVEARRLRMWWWIYAVLTFTVALAFAFPLFMLMRERKMNAAGGS
jgi:hypothetical protein